MTRLLLLPIAIFLFAQCSSTKESNKEASAVSNITSIQWGKSFGMCRGYCLEEFTFTADSVFKHQQSWQPDLYPDKDSSWMDSAPFNLFAVDVQYDSLLALGDRLGCPDCADGGSEWLAFRMVDGRYHKVVFEFGTIPQSQGLLLAQIRAWYEKQSRK